MHLSESGCRQEPAVANLYLEVPPDVTTGRVEVVVGGLVGVVVGGVVGGVVVGAVVVTGLDPATEGAVVVVRVGAVVVDT